MANPDYIRMLNKISIQGLSRFPANAYLMAGDITKPDAILLRSKIMHEQNIPVALRYQIAAIQEGLMVRNLSLQEVL